MTIGIDICKKCPIGHSCPTTNLPPKVCLAGEYQDTEAETSCKICASGTYSLYGSPSCFECPPGHYCATPADVPKKCGQNTFSLSGATECTTCQNGNYCPSGITYAEPSPLNCPKGLYCDNTKSPVVQPVLAGYYQPSEGAT